MKKSLANAIEKVKRLSPERQELAAEVLEQIAESGGDPYRLTDDERRLVGEGIDDLDAGRIVSDDDINAFWVRHRT